MEERGDLLHLLNMVKEKDPDNFYERLKHPATGLSFLAFVFHSLTLRHVHNAHGEYDNLKRLYDVREAGEAASLVLRHQGRMPKNYTKNDFFDLVRFMVSPQRSLDA